MLTEYICPLCGLKVSSDIEREFKCLNCGNKTELTFKKGMGWKCRRRILQCLYKGYC